MKSIHISALAAIACLSSLSALAGEGRVERGFYAGAGGGVAGSEKRGTFADPLDSGHDGSLKLFAGYQINRYFGVEGGYLRTGNYTQVVDVNGTDISQKVKSHAWYTAGTARLPIGTAFALTGMLGTAFGHVSGEHTVTGAESLIGSRTSVIASFGAQYRVTDSMDVQFDLTGVDKLSDNLSAGTITLSLKKRF